MRSREPYWALVRGRHNRMALSSGYLGSLTLDARGLRGGWECRLRPPPPPGGGLRPGGGGVLWLRPVGALEVPVAPRRVATLGAALAVSSGWGVNGDPLPLACLPLQHAPHHPKLDNSPHEAVPKGLSGFLQCSMLLVRLHGTAGRSCIPSGVCRLELVNAVPGAPRQLLAQVHHVVGDLAFEFD